MSSYNGNSDSEPDGSRVSSKAPFVTLLDAGTKTRFLSWMREHPGETVTLDISAPSCCIEYWYDSVLMRPGDEQLFYHSPVPCLACDHALYVYCV
ncbi:hypothetical protein EXIGLDRAFT_716688 [Exidia glandulosa HHB12029]|uniref:Uncharacterized protein n=1 Tax=Exidia glandulosa HHB12029 TaxID=1314781 RepID=A0A165IT21_EXIGL|nr:hypothetical protein EXIGLDRAFT_716688 [Exidia glandulosa HHB12029]